MNMFQKITALLLIMLATQAVATDDVAEIRALISQEFDRPGAAVVSDPIVIEQEFAVADWIQGEKGGRALLRKRDGEWLIMLCAGDGVRQAKSMIEADVPSLAANALAAKLADAGSGLSSSQVEMFGRFKAEKRPGDEHAGHH